MIKISRASLDPELAARLNGLTSRLHAAIPSQRGAEARRLWRNGATRAEVHAPLLRILNGMAPGVERCMYCGDGQGSDVDHFEPLVRQPLRAFDWLNHLLACAICNSHYKRERFPEDGDGNPLLIDPTIEDPLDHIRLTLATGTYAPLTTKGEISIDVFQLNRRQLVEGRLVAWVSIAELLRTWLSADERQRARTLWVVKRQPFADVSHAMMRRATAPGATVVFAEVPGLLEALRDDSLRRELMS